MSNDQLFIGRGLRPLSSEAGRHHHHVVDWAVGNDASTDGALLHGNYVAASSPLAHDALAGSDAAPDSVPSTVPEAQIWFGFDGIGASTNAGHLNDDGSGVTAVSHPNKIVDVGVDTAAGYLFTIDDETNNQYTLYERNYTTGAAIQSVQIAHGVDLIGAMAVDTTSHIVYVGLYNDTTDTSGIVEVSYDEGGSLGALDQSAKYDSGAQPLIWNDTQTFHGQSGDAGAAAPSGDVRSFSLDQSSHNLYFVDSDNNYSDGTGFHETNGVYVINTANATAGGVTQLTLSSQFAANTDPSGSSQTSPIIGAVAVNAAHNLVYFTTYAENDSGSPSGYDAIWEMSTNGGTATKLTNLPGAFHYAGAEGGLVYDAATNELFVSDANTTNGNTGIVALQLDSSYINVTASTTYSSTTLGGVGAPSGLAINELPILGVTGTTFSATERVQLVQVANSDSVSDVDGGYLRSATVQITGGDFTTSTSDENSSSVETLSYLGSASGTFNNITYSYNSATETFTMSGYDTLSNYQNILNHILFADSGHNSTDYGNHTTRTLTWTISDGSLNVGSGGQNTATTTFSLAFNDDAATITAPGGTDAKSITETNAGLSGTGSLTITDVDNLSNTMTVKSVAEADLGGAPASGISNATLLSYLTLASGTATHAATATSSTDGWTFDSGSQAFDYLAPGESLQLTYVVESYDGYTSGASDGNHGLNDHNVTITITGTNDAPVATGTVAGPLSNISEDTASPAGATVTSLFSSLFSDPDDNSVAAGQLGGVAVTAAGTTGGVWQYESSGVWHSLSAASTTSAILVAAGDSIRFLPDANWNGDAPTLTVHLADGSSAITSGSTADLTTTGGTTAYSTGAITLGEHVDAVNDAPTIINGTTASLPTIPEDPTVPSSETVQNLFAAHFSDTADAVPGGSTANVFAGVAVTGDAATSEGDWYYSTNGGASWTSLAGVSDANAVVLDGTDLLMFVQAADNYNGAAPGLTVHLIDDSAGTVTGGSTADLTITGGATQYSAGTVTLGETITPVNDAPTVINGTTATLASILEDASNPVGDTVSNLFGSHFSDAADNSNGSTANGFAGIAVTGDAAAPSQGSWETSHDGVSWADLGSASDGSAILVAAGDYLRFVPGADWNGTTPALTVHLVDDSGGAITTGSFADLTTTGGTTPYSAGTVALSETVTAVNDAPTIINGAATTLGTIAEDAASPAGDTVDNLYGAHFSDAADQVSGGSSADTFAGIVVTGDAATASQGAWQYFSAGAWHDLSAASDSNGIMVAHGDSLRFLPAADWNGDTPALTVHLVDSSWGTVFSGSTIDLTVVGSTGGTSSFSGGTIDLTETVTAVNDAPVVTAPTATAAAIAEDTATPVTIDLTALLSANFSDAKDQVTGGSSADFLQGIAVTGDTATAAQGDWQYMDSGGIWHSLAGASTLNAILVDTSEGIRFVPAADFNGAAPTLTVHLVDSSGGSLTSGDTIDLSAAGATGGTTAISTGTIDISETVTAVNDAPTVINGNFVTLGAIAEDTTSPAGDTVQNLIASHFSDAADQVAGGSSANGFAGVAVTADGATVEGQWQYSGDGGTTWTDLSGASNGSAVLIAASDLIRFLPAADWNGDTPVLTLHLVDDSSGAITTGDTADLTTTGGTTQYSAGVVDLGETVTSVNDAPVVINGATATLGAISEDASTPAGDTVDNLFASHFSDPGDAAGPSGADGFAGIAVTGDAASSSQGQWEYSGDGGTTWTDLAGASDSNAVLIAHGDLLRFLPSADWNGTTPDLTVHLADDSAGGLTTGTSADLTTTGGSTPYSSGTVALSETVTAVNDAPTIINGATTTLAAIAEDATNPAGDTVQNLFGSHFSDAADQVAGGSSAGAFLGIAVTGDAATSEGDWQYSTDGTTWTTLAGATEATAVLLNASTLLRFLPSADFNGAAPTLDAHLIETGSFGIIDGSTTDLSVAGTTGGTSHVSAGTVGLSETVNAVNDAPVVTAQATQSVTEDVATALTGISFSDVDANGASETVTFTVGSGALSTTALAGVTVGGTDQALTLTGTIADLNAFISGNHLLFTTGQDSDSDVALGISIDDGGASGTGGSLTGTGSSTIEVTAVNDAPTIVNGTTATLATIFENAANPAGDTVNDLFASHFSDADPSGSGANFAGILITGDAATSEGSWQYSSDGGTTWTDVGPVSDSNALELNTSDMLRFLPSAGYNGTAPALTVHLADDSGGGLSTGGHTNPVGYGGSNPYSGGAMTLTDTVTAINHAPSGHDRTIITSEDTPVVIHTGAFGFSDADGNSLYGVKITTIPTAGQGTLTDNGVAVSVGQVVLASDIAAGLLVYTPAADANGKHEGSFTFQVVDDGGTANGGHDTDVTPNTMYFNVRTENDPPVVSNPIDDKSANFGDKFTYIIPGDTFSDPDTGDTLTYTATLVGGGALPSWLTFDAAHHTFTGVPPESSIGTLPIEVTATDSHGASVSSDFNLDVLGDLNLVGTPGQDTLIGHNGNDTITGLGDDDKLSGGHGDDLLLGGDGNDTMLGGLGSDTMRGGAGADHFDGSGGHDVVQYWDSPTGLTIDLADPSQNTGIATGDTWVSIERFGGSAHDDVMIGDSGGNSFKGFGGADSLTGGDGGDTLIGGDGNDTLVGGKGHDLLIGGDGADHFVFTAISDSSPDADRDVIADFTPGQDVVDLHALEPTAGTAMTWLGTAAFGHHAGEVRYVVSHGDALVSVDTDGDGHADLQIRLHDVTSLNAGDFLL